MLQLELKYIKMFCLLIVPSTLNGANTTSRYDMVLKTHDIGLHSLSWLANWLRADRLGFYKLGIQEVFILLLLFSIKWVWLGLCSPVTFVKL